MAFPHGIVFGITVAVLTHFSVLSQRYWNCNPTCPTKCSDTADASKAVCAFIKDVTTLAVSFKTKCHFDCANNCYANSLTINNQGDCPASPPPTGSSEEKGSEIDDEETIKKKRQIAGIHYTEYPSEKKEKRESGSGDDFGIKEPPGDIRQRRFLDQLLLEDAFGRDPNSPPDDGLWYLKTD